MVCFATQLFFAPEIVSSDFSSLLFFRVHILLVSAICFCTVNLFWVFCFLALRCAFCCQMYLLFSSLSLLCCFGEALFCLLKIMVLLDGIISVLLRLQ